MPSNPPRSPESSTLQRAAANALQSRTVRVETLDGYLFRTYRLTTSKDFFYLLRCRPSHNIRLLRHEEDRLEIEGITLRMLSSRMAGFSARLIDYHTTTIPIGSKYLISGPFEGSILADIEPSLSRQACANIDRSLGQYVRSLAAVTGASFGSIRQAPEFGSQSWGRVFAAMLETVLRDGEDALINLPYESMKDLMRRHRACLDQITQPRLVLLELSADDNVVVDTKTDRVTGLLDFSTAFWGDPYMSDCWYKPTKSFAEGFGKLPNGDTDERTRQYLYVLYHALLAIVRRSYRPSEGSDELDARRDLTTAIRQLTAMVR
ncbi:hypothetical protein LTR91_006379 [Friedmanniomyces endolithicus]|uniref:Aminoglycoside phosphotransferase domain-containing protein n=1 Tax=Friedmanniomyces endolithicus TaxID=329885 RepID=A0AAN6KS61_9PEZI|nr:hypothetical protein LTR35_002132 [Friedmanniomyces endolithicus]KAK0299824.1 hypothetical protein LTS00_001594 [Friedmanniomyces endolithicus]KAK0305095.1 hypothetical protein LTR01_006953 [Friedmanniomyces endolithicus]KAK0826238.1 hypothetical protein LTR73_006572 [Friedmanniomyces endolithicus]KAK0909861.1 hypothetical protein LTR57_016123 [Friedmanniomyces endolithicus]